MTVLAGVLPDRVKIEETMTQFQHELEVVERRANSATGCSFEVCVVVLSDECAAAFQGR